MILDRWDPDFKDISHENFYRAFDEMYTDGEELEWRLSELQRDAVEILDKCDREIALSAKSERPIDCEEYRVNRHRALNVLDYTDGPSGPNRARRYTPWR